MILVKYTVKATYTGQMWVGAVYDLLGNMIAIVEPDGKYKFYTYTTK